MASLTLHIVKETLSTGYKVTMTAQDAVEITPKIFVLKRTDNSYDRVANTNDMTDLPDVPTNGITTYRNQTMIKLFDFDELELANRFLAEIPPMVDRLVLALSDPAFDGSEDVTIPI